jgi:HlyD family secretion protein
MDAGITNLESAKAGLEQAEASLEGADVNLRYATITSPISGVVISRAVDVGQTVAASLSAPTLFTIANDLKKMQVQANVDEADIGNVKTGQQVTFRVDSYPEDQFEGVVSQVRLAPVTVQNVVSYTVIVAVANPDLKLMPGMTATVSIEVDKRENVLRVPIQAIRFTPPDDGSEDSQQSNIVDRSDSTMGGQAMKRRDQSPQDPSQGQRKGTRRDRGSSDSSHRERQWSRPQKMVRARVWVMDAGKPKAISIARGLMNTQYVEVLRGELKEGDEVIIGATGGQTASGSGGQSNPFQPRMPGGGRGRGF